MSGVDKMVAGWEVVKNRSLRRTLDMQTSQMFKGEWVIPVLGCDSLQIAIDESILQAKKEVFDDLEAFTYKDGVKMIYKELKKKHLSDS